jgi:hypothetical protein
MIRFVPPVYIGRYHKQTPIGSRDWQHLGYDAEGRPPQRGTSAPQAPYADTAARPANLPRQSPAEAEAQEFFRQYAALYEDAYEVTQRPDTQAEGTELFHPVGRALNTDMQGRVSPPPMLAPQFQQEIVYRQQGQAALSGETAVTPPKSLNQPIKVEKSVRLENGMPFTQSQLDKLTDRVFSQIEKRIRDERRRFGL